MILSEGNEVEGYNTNIWSLGENCDCSMVNELKREHLEVKKKKTSYNAIESDKWIWKIFKSHKPYNWGATLCGDSKGERAIKEDKLLFWFGQLFA